MVLEDLIKISTDAQKRIAASQPPKSIPERRKFHPESLIESAKESADTAYDVTMASIFDAARKGQRRYKVDSINMKSISFAEPFNLATLFYLQRLEWQGLGMHFSKETGYDGEEHYLHLSW